ncbi:MAG: hypothetical protein RIT02_631, partial [Planctomycetota bacterium]
FVVGVVFVPESFLCDSDSGCSEPLHSGPLSSVTLMRFLRFCVSAFLPFCDSQSCAGRSPAREFEKQGRPLGTRRPLEGRPRDAPWEGDAPAEPNPLNRTPKPRTPTVTPSRDRDRRQADHWSPACQRRLPHGSAGASPSQGRPTHGSAGASPSQMAFSVSSVPSVVQKTLPSAPLRFSVSLRVLRGEKTPHYQQLAQAPSGTSNLLFGSGMHMPAARQEPRPSKGNFTDH